MTRKDALESAIKCVCADREREYGTPEDNFTIIARYWAEYTRGRYGVCVPYTGQDVAAMMILLKIARVASGNQKDDNWIDIAGYAACGAELMEE